MRKLFLGLAGITCSLAITIQPALAMPGGPQDPDVPFSAEVHIVDQGGDHAFQVDTPGLTLSSFLVDKGLDLKDYRYGDNKELDGTNILDDQEVAKIYKVSSKGESTLVDLPIPTEVKNDAKLLVGNVKVETEGSQGKLLKTVVVTGLRGSEVKSTEETLIVLEAPKPRVLLVGTKQPVVETPPVAPAPSRGVESPRVVADDEELEALTKDASNEALVTVLTAQVGKSYVWGDEGPASFDCSGLVYYVMNQSGIKVPRLTATGYGSMATPVDLKDIQEGDIFWNTEHIGIYAGNGKVIHAANPRVGVIVTNLSYFTSGKYSLARLS